MRKRHLLVLSLALMAGCSATADESSGDDAGPGAGSGGDESTGGGGTTGTAGNHDAGGGAGTNAAGGGHAGGTGGTNVPGRDPASVCARWNADRAQMTEGAWNGDVASCQAGTLASPGPENTVRMVNLYRWLAGLPEVKLNPSMSAGAQQCALMMHANDTLDHYPQESWKCYSGEGASAASVSLLVTMPSVSGIDLFMLDFSSPFSMGHRRNILGDGLEEVGVGSTDEYSCLRTVDAVFVPAQDVVFTAWPPAGAVPLQAFDPMDYGNLDGAGWTVQTNRFSLEGAQVKVTEDGVDRPVQTAPLQDYMGNYYAFKFRPDGWDSEAGHVYHVTVTNVEEPIEYDVQVVDCQ